MKTHKDHAKGFYIEERVRKEKEATGGVSKDGLSVYDRTTKAIIKELDENAASIS
jgi:hypothetical protein